MKKTIVFILAALYLCSTAGATIHLHYCMDKLVNWTLSGKRENKCDNCGMEKEGGCCKDEQKLIKNNTDQKIAESTIQILQPSAVITPSPILYTFELYTTLTEKYSSHRGPPNPSGTDLHIYNCVFRI